MQRDAQQAALGSGVDRQVECDAGHLAVDRVLHAAGGLLRDQQIVGPKNAMLVGPVSPETAVRTSRRASVIVGGVWA